MAAKKFLSGIDNSSQKIINLADGSVASDAATYGQLMNLINGLDFKSAVVAASTANINITSPGSTIDTVTLANGNGILLKNQTTGSENGLWVWNGATSALTRRADGVTGELTQGSTVVVTGGATNIDTQWTLNTADTITVGTTAQTWVQSGGSGATYTAGNGLQVSTQQFSVKLPANSGLVADGTGLYIDSTIVPRKYAALVGDGTSTSITVTHNLNTRDVHAILYDAASYAEVETDIVHATANTLTLIFGAAPASGAYRVVVIG